MKDKKRLNPKVKKYLNYAVNAVTVLICVFAVLIAISTIASKGKGYVNILGSAYYSVATGSMDGDQKDSFAEGDAIRVKILKDDQKTELEEGQIITFLDQTIRVNNVPQPNTHRIVAVIETPDGEIYYRTKGDANTENDEVLRASDEVIGVYAGKSNGIGKALLWMQTKDGFLVCVVVPSGIIFIYCFVMVILNIISYNKKKILLTTEEKQANLESELEEKLREKILKEMQEKSAEVAADKTDQNDSK